MSGFTDEEIGTRFKAGACVSLCLQVLLLCFGPDEGFRSSVQRRVEKASELWPGGRHGGAAVVGKCKASSYLV